MTGTGMARGMKRSSGKVAALLMSGVFVFLLGCASADIPDARNVNIPSPTFAEKRRDAVNERPDSVMYLPLGRDVLMPEVASDDDLPTDEVGPFELRGETLAGALQLILADYDVPLAFETDEGLTKPITVANLRGPLNKVVRHLCGLAELYCAYEDGIMVVKDTQTFTVKIPPISQDESFMQNVAGGLKAITGTDPIIDQSTRTIIYDASQRTSDLALRYFQRMRTSTALIVFETYIWEVSLDSGNSTGVNWQLLDSIGKFNTGINLTGSIGIGANESFSSPVSIGLPVTGSIKDDDGNFAASKVFEFLSRFGAVKTISQPQITVLSGSEATLRAADRTNFVSNISETLDNGQSTTSVSTDSVDTGFTLTIASAWDNATVYADINISLTDVLSIDDFAFESGGGSSTQIQLPRTTEREVTTQVRIRPGDSLLLAGLVREDDNFQSSGPGLEAPAIPTSRTAETSNVEVVFLMRPRVIVYTNPDEKEHYNAVRKLPAKGDASPVAEEGGIENVSSDPLRGEAQSLPVVAAPVSPEVSSSPASAVPVASAYTLPEEIDSSVEVAPLEESIPAGIAPTNLLNSNYSGGAQAPPSPQPRYR
ncbi:MAG: type II and III secretion system family protein [Micavibrio aeruginosavorus]|nr:type II and III secretion system family protein [Micavibrio aeruginosavorus]